jgi:hypothetical protein
MRLYCHPRAGGDPHFIGFPEQKLFNDILFHYVFKVILSYRIEYFNSD